MKMFSTPSVLLLAMALGAGAGIVASSLTLNSLYDYSVAISSSGPIRLAGERPQTEPSSYEQATQEVREKVSSATVEIFSKPSDVTGAYEPGEGQGSGFFITSDGWLVAAPYFFSIAETAQAKILFNEKIYSVEKVIDDSTSAVVFLKIDIANAPVVSFGEALSVEPGDYLFVAAGARELFVSSFFRSIHVGDISEPAETFSHRFELTMDAESYFTGAPVANSSGDVIGILTSEEFGETHTVLPLSAIKPAVYSLLKSGEIITLWFGAMVTDLSRAIGYDETFTRGYTKGALLGTITKGSPAETAGLTRGDIIISVGGQELSASLSLDELLTDYHSGDVLNLVIDRGGIISKVDLTLGSR
jgi:serine protease Do